MRRDVFIIGCRGLPANYGGYETFVEHLTSERKNKNILYHVACRTDDKSRNNKRFEYNNSDCFDIYVPNIGSVQAIYYDVQAIIKSIKYIRSNNISDPIFYILGCSIGPLILYAKKLIKSVGGSIYINPDGHEWMRTKWNYFIRKYLKYSEKIMVKNSDMVVCDSSSIKKYILRSYNKISSKTIFIAYGASYTRSRLENNNLEVTNWFKKFNVTNGEYYLIVGRFVPENNFETMLREFIKSKTDKDLVIVTNVEGNKFYNGLKKRTTFSNDDRIKFVGTVYNSELLKKIRENAFAYIHGHSVGGTNPSLLQALASTKINLLYDVGFNREVAEKGGLYWSLEEGNLSYLIDKVDSFTADEIEKFDAMSTKRIINYYKWSDIIEDYEQIFRNENKET